MSNDTLEIADIQQATKEYAAAQNKLESKLNEMKEDLEAVRRKHIAHIKNHSVEVADKLSVLKNAIDMNKGLFVKPKTYVFHGFKVGLTSTKKSWKVENSEATIKAIEKLFKDNPDKLESLIKTEKKVINDGLKKLSEKELEKIDVEVVEPEDKVTIKNTSDDFDKLVEKIIAGMCTDDVAVDIKKAA